MKNQREEGIDSKNFKRWHLNEVKTVENVDMEPSEHMAAIDVYEQVIMSDDELDDIEVRDIQNSTLLYTRYLKTISNDIDSLSSHFAAYT